MVLSNSTTPKQYYQRMFTHFLSFFCVRCWTKKQPQNLIELVWNHFHSCFLIALSDFLPAMQSKFSIIEMKLQVLHRSFSYWLNYQKLLRWGQCKGFFSFEAFSRAITCNWGMKIFNGAHETINFYKNSIDEPCLMDQRCS